MVRYSTTRGMTCAGIREIVAALCRDPQLLPARHREGGPYASAAIADADCGRRKSTTTGVERLCTARWLQKTQPHVWCPSDSA